MEHQVLVIAPQPGEEVLGCGGSVAKLTAAGSPVHVGYLTSGEQGSGEIPRRGAGTAAGAGGPRGGLGAGRRPG
jgi:LmbE family N-acetylglucosaminyl deacetylase